MLEPANVRHLAMLRSLIRQGAQDGSFDRQLAEASPEAEAFFAKLKSALVTGYFVEERRSGKIDTVAVPGYVFWPEGRNGGSQPAGFGLFSALKCSLNAGLITSGVMSVHSVGTPRSPYFSCSARTPFSSMSSAATRRPSLTNPATRACPIPPAAPVTMATFPAIPG